MNLEAGSHKEMAGFVKQGSDTDKLGIYWPGEPLR